ncbi:MAG: 1-acyl-sn-glycerol-3-phosphate acyltransferase [Deltaproteobacteria bacterium]|nr:MAG: 1-acyl-sn-glycerol-3-phosphate acyltransferase [Deltaproteobacteria bacterium]
MSDRTPIPLPPDGLGAKVVAALLWWLGLLWMVPMMLLMMVVALFVPPDRTEWLSRLYCRGQVALTLSSWRAVVDPAVDPKGTYVFCQNHINLLDHVTMYPCTPHFKQGIELEAHFRIPIYGWFMKQRGTIGVRRGEPDVFETLRKGMAAEAERGHSLLVFPEGTRTTTGRVGRFRTGSFRLARELGLPVVPVAVTGMYEVLRKGSWLMRPGHAITVHVLAPIETKGLSDEEILALSRKVEAQIAEVVDAYWAERGLLPAPAEPAAEGGAA